MGGVLWRSVSSSGDADAVADPVVSVPSGPVSIVRVTSYDPNGDDNMENDDQLPNLLDNDVKTQWRTVCYGNKFFGQKEGVGFVVELSTRATGTLSVDVGHSPWAMDIYTAIDAIPAQLSQWGPRIDKSYGTELGIPTFNVKEPTQFVLVYLREAARSPQCSTKNPFQGVVNGISFASLSAP